MSFRVFEKIFSVVKEIYLKRRRESEKESCKLKKQMLNVRE